MALFNRARLEKLVAPPANLPIVIFVVFFVFFFILSDVFRSPDTFSGILNAQRITGIIAIGVVMLMITGEFDLSVGVIAVMGAYVFSTLYIGGHVPFGIEALAIENGLFGPLALLFALAAGALLGAFNGFIIYITKIPSFIATLGTFFIYNLLSSQYANGAAFEAVFSEDNPKPWLMRVFGENIQIFSDFSINAGVFWWLFLIIVFQFILVRTTFGNQLFAIGGNILSASSQGVRSNAIKIATFAMAGMLAGFAGVIQASEGNAVYVLGSIGTNQELLAIAAAVIGGTLLTGGYGSIVGGFVGVLTISLLRTGIVRSGLIPSDNFIAVVGLTIVVFTVINAYIRRRI